MLNRLCSIEGCNNQHLARGLCQRHYMQQRRAGVLDRQAPENDDFQYLIKRIKVSDSGCWIWQQSTREGYGRLVRHGKTWSAHIFSFVSLVGMVPEGKQVNHMCHIRACCNPGHLYAGSQSENMADMKSAGRGRYLRGNENGNSRVDEQAAKAIYASSGIARDVAEKFGVSISLVYAIRKKKVWGHINE